MSLLEAFEPLSWDVAFWLQAATDEETPVDELGELCLELEEKLRGLAIILLLTEAKTDAFLHNLIRAAGLWRRYLDRCAAEGVTADHNLCAGRFEPFLDAVAARELTLAGALAQLAPRAFHDGHEDEADYCYARVLYGLFLGPAAYGDVAQLLERCAKTGDEMSAARADVCHALLASDQAAFADTFSSLLSARRAEIEAEDERGRVVTPQMEASRAVFVEGVALLNLAERRGLVLEPDYPMCPSLARVPMQRPYPGQ